MADSGSLRTIRWKRHKAGDHSLCRRCAAVRGEVAPAADLAAVAGTGPLDKRGELEALARRLVAAHEREPDNAIVARELRATLLVIPDEPAGDVMDELRAMADRVS